MESHFLFIILPPIFMSDSVSPDISYDLLYQDTLSQFTHIHTYIMHFQPFLSAQYTFFFIFPLFLSTLHTIRLKIFSYPLIFFLFLSDLPFFLSFGSDSFAFLYAKKTFSGKSVFNARSISSFKSSRSFTFSRPSPMIIV